MAIQMLESKDFYRLSDGRLDG